MYDQAPDEATSGWLTSFAHVAQGATWTILTMILFNMVQMINLWFIGHQKNPDLLGGLGLGNMLLNVLVFALSNGLNSTIESFASWSYG